MTTEVVSAVPLEPDLSLNVALAPGRVVEIPVPVVAGETLSIATSSRDYWDSIAVLSRQRRAAVEAAFKFWRASAGVHWR